jgi:hypothetical protein
MSELKVSPAIGTEKFGKSKKRDIFARRLLSKVLNQ